MSLIAEFIGWFVIVRWLVKTIYNLFNLPAQTALMNGVAEKLNEISNSLAASIEEQNAVNENVKITTQDTHN